MTREGRTENRKRSKNGLKDKNPLDPGHESHHISHSGEVGAPEMPAPLSVAGHTALPVTEGSGTSTAATCRPADRICRPPGAARPRSAFADRNVDRPVESANVDIPARHLRDANVDPVAICLRDAYLNGGNERRGRQADMHPVRFELSERAVRRWAGTMPGGAGVPCHYSPSQPSCPDLFHCCPVKIGWTQRKALVQGGFPALPPDRDTDRGSRVPRRPCPPLVTPDLIRGPEPQAPPSPGFPGPRIKSGVTRGGGDGLSHGRGARAEKLNRSRQRSTCPARHSKDTNVDPASRFVYPMPMSTA